MQSIRTLVADCLGDRWQEAVTQIERGRLWEQVADYAINARVGGMLLCELKGRGVAPTKSATRQLEAYADHLRAAHTYRTQCVAPVLSALADHGIPFLLLKGAALSAALYSDAGIRPMVDVDILIRPSDAPAAEDALHRCGCRPGPELMRGDFFPRYHYEREYFTPDLPAIKIDLHVRPLRPLRYSRTVPEMALWSETRETLFAGQRIRQPGTNDMLIHMAVHAACHGLRELRWLYDIKAWLARNRDELDWEVVFDRCRAWKLTLPFNLAMKSVEAAFDIPIPELRRSNFGNAQLLDHLAIWQAPHGVDRPAIDVLVNFISTPGVQFRLAYLAAALLPDDSHLEQTYARKHFGWRVMAHGQRLGRLVSRTLAAKGRGAA